MWAIKGALRMMNMNKYLIVLIVWSTLLCATGHVQDDPRPQGGKVDYCVGLMKGMASAALMMHMYYGTCLNHTNFNIITYEFPLFLAGLGLVAHHFCANANPKVLKQSHGFLVGNLYILGNFLLQCDRSDAVSVMP